MTRTKRTEAGDVAQRVKDILDIELISKSSGVPWSDCCDALEEIADHAQEWADQIRSEHE